MKNKLFLIFLSVAFLSKAQINNGIITYQKQVLEKTFINNKKKKLNFEKFKAIEERLIDVLKEIEFQLVFNNEESLFQVVKTLKTESDRYFKMAIIPHGRSVFYVSMDKSVEQRTAFGEDFLILKDKIIWELKNESKQIGKYTCYKAETTIKKMYNGDEKEYPKIAWYCPEINIPFGPIGYGGLPGLILELIDGKNSFIVKKIKLNVNKLSVIEPPSKGKEITELELSKKYDDAFSKIESDRK